MNSLESVGYEAGKSVISENRLEDSESESESELNIMQEISNTIKETNANAGEPVVFEIGDVETSTDTIDLEDEVLMMKLKPQVRGKMTPRRMLEQMPRK